jgi:hypothetical protein
MPRNPKLVSVGDDWRSWPPELWGTRDRARAERERWANERHQPFGPGPIVESPHALKGFGGLYDRGRPRPSAQAIAADHVLKSFGVR